MIWIRRLLIVPVGILFLALLLIAVVAIEVGDTFLEPDFYTKELEKADAYHFLLNDLLTTAIEDARRVKPGEGIFRDLDVNPIVESRLTTAEIVGAVNRAIPPEWVQAQVEEAIAQIGGYVAAERDDFTFTVRAGEQVPVIVSQAKDLLQKADAYNLLFEEVITPAIKNGVTQKLPLGLEVSSDRLVEAVRRIVPPEWVRMQVEAALDESSDYMTGKKDSLRISVQLGDRVPVALEEIKAILREIEVYDVLYEEVVAPELARVLSSAVALPAGIAVTNDEVLSALRQVAPVDWVREQVERLIDGAGPYLAGQQDSFAVAVSLVENKREARKVIIELVGGRLTDAVQGLPRCQGEFSTRDFAALERLLQRGDRPQCIPASLDRAKVLDVLQVQLGQQVDSLILASVPDKISFTADNLLEALRQAGAGENVARVDDARAILRDGWVRTDADLRRWLNDRDPDEGVRRFDDLRSYLSVGWTYTDADFLRDAPEFQDSGDIGKYRGYLKNARRYRLALYLPVIALFLLIGLLGGRTWPGRLRWASVLLLLSAALILVAFGPVYSSLKGGFIDDAREEATADLHLDPQFAATSQLVVDKVVDVGETAIDDFAGGVKRSALVLLIAGLVMVAASVAWSRSSRSGQPSRSVRPRRRVRPTGRRVKS